MTDQPQIKQIEDTTRSHTVVSVDAMGGDNGPATVVAGLARCAKKDPSLRFILHGQASVLTPLLDRRRLGDVVELRDCAGVVEMADKPSQVLRSGKDTSMWS